MCFFWINCEKIISAWPPAGTQTLFQKQSMAFKKKQKRCSNSVSFFFSKGPCFPEWVLSLNKVLVSRKCLGFQETQMRNDCCRFNLRVWRRRSFAGVCSVSHPCCGTNQSHSPNGDISATQSNDTDTCPATTIFFWKKPKSSKKYT